MNIYVIGNDHQSEEVKKKISLKHSIVKIQSVLELVKTKGSIVFDFTLDDNPENLDMYAGLEDIILFVNSTRNSLGEMAYFSEGSLPQLFGFAGDPTFLERTILEVSVYTHNTIDHTSLFKKMGLHAAVVQDRLGFVTPRIISMIINEAFFTVQENTATREDIDTGMKLGTNYPMGPFEWSNKWGLDKIYELLDALYLDTREERYKICPLLKKEYLALASY